MSNILLIGPRFFGYCDRIAKRITKDGHSVAYIPDRPSESFYSKVIIRLRPSLFKSKCFDYFVDEFSKIPDFFPDVVLIIKGEGIQRSTLEHIRTIYPDARYVNYQWDAAVNVPTFHECKDLYDAVFSFDKNDANHLGVDFCPLFYFDEQLVNAVDSTSELKYDISFVGTIHSDRYSIIKKIDKALPCSIRRLWYRYITDWQIFLVRKIFSPQFWNSKLSDFKLKPLSHQEVINIFNTSNCVLDIERPQQIGLTIRTLEVLSAGKKIITTNKAIEEYDLFESGNVLVIDRKNPKVSLDFISTKPNSVDKRMMNSYSISSWLQRVVYMFL